MTAANREAIGRWFADRLLFWRCIYWMLFVDHSVEFSTYRTGMFLLQLSAEILARRNVRAHGFWYGWWREHFWHASDLLMDSGWSGAMIRRNFSRELKTLRSVAS